MKYVLPVAAIYLLCMFSAGGELPAELKALKQARLNQVKIAGVSSDMFRNDKDEKIETIRFFTYQDEDDELSYRVRITAEMTDRNDAVYFAQIQIGQGPVDTEYTGEDAWEFQIAHGKLNKPELSAYAIQYGFFEDGIFVPVAEQFYRVESPDEITARAKAGRVDIRCTKHTYKYRSGDEILDSASNHASLQ